MQMIDVLWVVGNANAAHHLVCIYLVCKTESKTTTSYHLNSPSQNAFIWNNRNLLIRDKIPHHQYRHHNMPEVEDFVHFSISS
jgi:hypothetical protein